MDLLNMLEGYKPYESIVKNLKNTPISVSGVVDSAQPQLIAALAARSAGRTLAVTYSDMEARQLAEALRVYSDNVAVFTEKEYVFYNIETMGRANANARLSVLDRLISGEKLIVTASVPALMSYTADPKRFCDGVIKLQTGGICDIGELTEKLIETGYCREDMIEGPGQFSVRGGIIDIYSPNSELPVRVELWDDEIDSIRSFDPQTQRAVENIDKARVIPVREALYTKKQRDELLLELERRLRAAEKRDPESEYVKNLGADIEAFRERMHFPAIDKYISLIYGKIPSVLDYFSNEDMAFIIDPKRVSERLESFGLETAETVSELKAKELIGKERTELYRTDDDVAAALSKMRLIALEILSHTKNRFSFRQLISFSTKSAVSFHGKLEYLYEDLTAWQKNGYTAVVLAATVSRAENLAGVFRERGIKTDISRDGSFKKGRVTVMVAAGAGGYEYPDLKLAIVSEREIFEAKRSREKRRRESAERIKSYSDITPGDYVVHTAHGVGIYEGLIKMTVDGVAKDYLKIAYRGTDVLYVPIDQLELLHKYNGGGEDKPVKVNKLGTQEWTRAKAKVKSSTDELARELIKLYAERENTKGFAFSEDTPWQRDFEDTFEFTETQDQLRSIEEVKADMEKPRPMDRLLCGDVGFGKTEVALRAAFKAVCDGKQVAYLCPTTVLAMQHYETFSNRMADFPVTVEMLSRFRTQKEQGEIIKKLRDGRADIVIGTHRILSKDVTFKDLGLVLVDEEQRFGVAHKEKLKELKTSVDVLTMTATPIPRTLHMSMTSVRDMSVLSNPPHNRYPVRTYVLEYNEDVTDEAIRRELARGGQVFYLYNRVQGIYHKAQMLKNRFPDAEIAVGHGKLTERELEDIMYDMVTGRTQILVCTTIIETGLDIPNANTIIIENADKMGLAQLYQLRGRVGRSNRAAYAYLTYKRDKILSTVSQKRLSAIREFTEFGSGFRIAMRDLEIRGAGNILGAEQHGHMDNVGYDMYCKRVQESLDVAQGLTAAQEDVSIDISVNAYIPETYIPSAAQRIDMYKKIAAIENEADETEIRDELIDRYGEPPLSVQNIISVAALKLPAREVG
ncbi:MAG: transcription-repair coupling factor, partial [Clostridia bacterium]|nr:transcription-repair coupling factor [Clostridia bacterium]